MSGGPGGILAGTLTLMIGGDEKVLKRTKKYLDRYEEAMRGNSAAFGSRLDRGWVPPSLDDLEAELAAADDEKPEADKAQGD